MTRERCCCRALDVRQSTKVWNQISFQMRALLGAPCAEEYTNSKNLLQLQKQKRTTVLAESRLGYTPIVHLWDGVDSVAYTMLHYYRIPALGPIHCSQIGSVLPG